MSHTEIRSREVLTPSLRWIQIGGVLFIGLFVAYLDRTNLSVGLTGVATDMGFAGNNFTSTSCWALTSFNIGHAIANILGGSSCPLGWRRRGALASTPGRPRRGMDP